MNVELREFLIELQVILGTVTGNMMQDQISRMINQDHIKVLNMTKFVVAKFYSENCEAGDAAVLDKDGFPNEFLLRKASNLAEKHMDEFFEALKNLDGKNYYQSMKDGSLIPSRDKKSSK